MWRNLSGVQAIPRDCLINSLKTMVKLLMQFMQHVFLFFNQKKSVRLINLQSIAAMLKNSRKPISKSKRKENPWSQLFVLCAWLLLGVVSCNMSVDTVVWDKDVKWAFNNKRKENTIISLFFRSRQMQVNKSWAGKNIMF